MDAVEEDRESVIRTAHDRGAHDEALTEALRLYGSEILGYLVSRLGDEDAAREVFADACEDMWSGLPRFSWRSSFRTWAYTVSRNACHRYLKRNRRRFFNVSTLPEVAERLRTRTAPYLRTEVKDKVAEMREQLSDVERELLILRIDRGLSWIAIAEILAEPEDDTRPDALKRASAACRKRFERVKDRLRTLARDEGLLD